MTTTTLMTFRLQTAPTVGSVKLLGSWDNFRALYSMDQDSRIGAGHWKGCFKMTGIICDGDVSAQSPVRDGGLKMGGTYWYYYELDGGVEYYNPAEPSTTSCPLLPGQEVNILQVPIYFSGEGGEYMKSHYKQPFHNRGRNASISSTSSDHHTMNPDDKFLKPRPAPKLPVPPPRLLTPQPYHHRHQHVRSASGPSSPSYSSSSNSSYLNVADFFNPRAGDSSSLSSHESCYSAAGNTNKNYKHHSRGESQPPTSSRRAFFIPRRKSPEGLDRRGRDRRSPSPSPRPSGFRAALNHLANTLANANGSESTQQHQQNNNNNTLVGEGYIGSLLAPLPSPAFPAHSSVLSASSSRASSPRRPGNIYGSNSAAKMPVGTGSSSSLVRSLSRSASKKRRVSVEIPDVGNVIIGNPFQRGPMGAVAFPPSRSREPSPERKDEVVKAGPPPTDSWTMVLPRKDYSRKNSIKALQEESLIEEEDEAIEEPQLTPGTPPQFYHEKRLPTLPNSPSSVFAEDRFALKTPTIGFDPHALKSHFSMSTVASSPSSSERYYRDSVHPGADTDDDLLPSKSHFSAWSTGTSAAAMSNYYTSSPSSMSQYSNLVAQSRFSEWTNANPGQSMYSANGLDLTSLPRSSMDEAVPAMPALPVPEQQQQHSYDASSPTLTSPSLASDATTDLSSADSQLGSPFEYPYTPNLASTTTLKPAESDGITISTGEDKETEANPHDFKPRRPRASSISSGLMLNLLDDDVDLDYEDIKKQFHNMGLRSPLPAGLDTPTQINPGKEPTVLPPQTIRTTSPPPPTLNPPPPPTTTTSAQNLLQVPTNPKSKTSSSTTPASPSSRGSLVAVDSDTDNDERVGERIQFRDEEEVRLRRLRKQKAREERERRQVDTIRQLMDDLAYLSREIREGEDGPGEMGVEAL